MSAYQKTAKDLAFDRERQRLKKQIKDLQEEIRKNVISLKSKDAIIDYTEELLTETLAENEKLKKMVNIPTEQLETHLKDEREKAERERATTAAIGSLLNLKNNIITY